MTFGDRLKKARKDKKMTQAELAQKIGVASTTLAGYENGNREPDLFKIKKLIEVLEMDSDYLLGVENKNATPEQFEDGVIGLLDQAGVFDKEISEEKLKLITQLIKDVLESDLK